MSVDRLRELLEKATPRPWSYEEDSGSQAADVVIPRDPRSGYGDRMCGTEENAALIVALVNAADSLLEVAEAARKTVKEAARYSQDGIPVSPTARHLYDVLARLDAHPEKPA